HYLHIRALHSFPTRRSSDLAMSWCYVETKNSVRPTTDRSPPSVPQSFPKRNSLPGPRRVLSTNCEVYRHRVVKPEYPLTLSQNRSEEHTSELQSLRHLVCRL